LSDISFVPRIMVVDDVAVNRTMVRMMLEREQYKILECETGQDCLDRCLKDPPDVVLLDVMMPEIDGFTVCKKLREHFAQHELPIILLTAKRAGEDQKEGLEVGANEYVTKPFDRIALIARIKNQLLIVESSRKRERQRAIIQQNLEIQKAVGDALPDGLAVHSDDGQLIYSNSNSLTNHHAEPPASIQELLGSIYGGEYSKELEEIYRNIASEPKSVVERELSHTGVRAGSYTHVYILSRPFTALNDDLRLWVFRDLSTIRQLESKIKQQVTLDTVGLFSTGVAHNFNNVLGPVLSAVELLERESLSAGSRAVCISIIKRAVGVGSALTTKLSRIIVADREQDGVTAHLAELVRSVCFVQGEVSGNHYSFGIDIPEDLIVESLSMVSLSEVLTQLVANACDSMHNDGTITISARRDIVGHLEIEIGDSGKGIAPDQLPRVFDPFYSTKNLDSVNGMSMVGNGLGLWSVHASVKQAGGDVEIKSILGKGTTVTLRLPN
jgi:CheY-like chemotaxis protein/signal transduction histidine kinase